MKILLRTAAVLLTITICIVSPVTAATSQGLEWNLDESDRFQYQLRVEIGDNVTVDDEFTIEITDCPTIPQTVDDWREIPSLGLDMRWINGSSMTEYNETILDDIAYVGGRVGVPLGNWTLLAELFSAWYAEIPVALDQLTVIDGHYYWGVDTRSVGQLYRILYLKEDGFLAEFEVHFYISSFSAGLTVTRDALPSDIQVLFMDNLVYIAIAAVAVVIVVVAWKRR